VSDRISVRARFERFPASVKGALLLRGEDAEPHQVVFHGVHAVGVAGEGSHPIVVAATTLDAAPRRDVFVPFELVTSDLAPGWYGFECDLEVDGVRGSFPGGRRFSVPWPRASVRRGTLHVDRGVRVGTARVRLEQVECGADSCKVGFVVQPPGLLTVRLSADDAKLEVLETEIDETSGRGRVLAYPVPKSASTLRVELKGHGRGTEATVSVPLA
jgi:hypothetical protein